MDEAKAKDDFESAFASFKNSSAKSAPEEASTTEQPKARSAFDSEFPPISELEKDDSSDSEDDQGGFDDDFAPASPHANPTEKPASPSLAKAVAPDAPAGGSDETAQSKAEDMFGSAPPPGSFPEPEPTPSTEAPAAAGSDGTTTGMSKQSSTFDDLDDDFADLEDAKEGSADDDFQTISRSGLDDFSATFDSPPPAAKSDAAAAPPGSSHGPAAPFSNESTFDFASIDNTASQASAAAPAEDAPKGPAQPDNHDWDAIFASLDDAPPAQSSGSPPPPGSAGSGAAPPAAAAAAAPAEPSKEAGSNGLLTGPRPTAPGRALTEDGEHDDPILKNLTSMGYSRGDALNALEKYDYNLERVS